MLLIALLLPVMVFAGNSAPVGNPAGTVLGIFAMCGTNPVDCLNGWCCLDGQTCTTVSSSPIPMCIDPTLVENSKTPAVVNAAYFGKIQQHQVEPPANGTTSKTNTQQSTTNASPQTIQPASLVFISSVIGGVAAILASL